MKIENSPLPDVELFEDKFWVTYVSGTRGDSIETSVVNRGFISGPYEHKEEAEAMLKRMLEEE